MQLRYIDGCQISKQITSIWVIEFDSWSKRIWRSLSGKEYKGKRWVINGKFLTCKSCNRTNYTKSIIGIKIRVSKYATSSTKVAIKKAIVGLKK